MSLMMQRAFSTTKLVGFGWTAGTLLLALAVVSQAAPQGKTPKAESVPERPRYNKDIRPILAENCFPCHGPDSAARKAGLRLDKFADATMLRDGRRAITPEDPFQSEIVKRILKPDDDALRMPPSSGHKALSDAEKKTLVRWIEQGAQYEKHWSYIAPKRPALPAVKNAAWVKNPIDRFTLAKLEANGSDARAGGGPADIGASPEPRFDRSAAGTGGRGSVCRGHSRPITTKST